MLILIIDDDPDDQGLFREAIQAVDPSIICQYASDGEQALQKLVAQDLMPDFIFLDVNMPIMDGREFIIQLKSRSRLKDVPVFVFSTTSNDKENTQFRNLGARDFIIKPHKFQTLVYEVGAIVKGSGQRIFAS